MNKRGGQPGEKVPLVVRFWSKVIPQVGGCWLWTAGVNACGYGYIKVLGRMQLAHRVAYALLVGEIPRGKEIDHVKDRGCEHRHCVNPAHLEVVTHAENVARGNAGAHLGAKTHCPKGHPYSPENTSIGTLGQRSCRICKRTDAAARRALRREIHGNA